MNIGATKFFLQMTQLILSSIVVVEKGPAALDTDSTMPGMYTVYEHVASWGACLLRNSVILTNYPLNRYLNIPGLVHEQFRSQKCKSIYVCI